MAYKLTRCDNGEVQYVSTDISQYLGQYVTSEKAPYCMLVEYYETSEVTPGTITVTDCYSSCEECSRIYYALTDCSGRYPTIYTYDQSLEGKSGNIIRVPYYQNSCFSILALASVDAEIRSTSVPFIEFSNTYRTCIECQPQEPTPAVEALEVCDPEKVERIKCKYVDLIHQQVLSKRFGVKFCCPGDLVGATISNELIDIQLLQDPDPGFPEPIVEYCCLQIPDPCQQFQNNCHECVETNPATAEGCNCTASVDSPYDCHIYSVSVTEEQIALATGNSNSWLNGKVFFGYFSCGSTASTFHSFEALGTEEFCVLGIPVFGYYANNEWVEIENPIRGAVCTEEENTCCNG